jgi:transcriptional regulator with XRE-family HTH domain
MNIGEKIKNIRKSQNISMNYLANKAEVSQANLSRIENGQQQPTFDTVKRIIAALGYNLNDFFAANSKEEPPDTKQLLRSIKKLNIEQKQALQLFLEKMLK